MCVYFTLSIEKYFKRTRFNYKYKSRNLLKHFAVINKSILKHFLSTTEDVCNSKYHKIKITETFALCFILMPQNETRIIIRG